MSSIAIREQLSFFETEPLVSVGERTDSSSTFAGNSALPIHRWFRYSAGFSATWVRQVIEREKANGRRTVLDPFAGSGTTTLEGEGAGLESIGLEAHPFVARIGQAKIQWRSDVKAFRTLHGRVLEYAEDHPVNERNPPKLLATCFPSATLDRLVSLRNALEKIGDG